MKLRNILTVMAVGLGWTACTPDDAEVFPNPVGVNDVKRLILTADHETLLPDGKAEMNFRILAVGEKEVKVKNKVEIGDSVAYVEELQSLEYLIPEDQMPAGVFVVYDENGNPLENKVFSTTRTDWESIGFYARGNNVTSNTLQIKRRELPDPEKYEEIVFPVIFHLLIPPYSSRPAYSISVEKLQEKLDRVNNIFNGLISKNPNGGNARIKFRLAEYDQEGKLLQEKGKNVINLTSALANQTAYEKYINTPGCIWDPERYLNIFVAKYSDSWTSTGAYTYVATPPNVIKTGETPILGMETAKEVEKFTIGDVKSYKDVAIMLNFEGVLNINSNEKNDATELATILGYYLGLKTMQYASGSLVDGDTDYCQDTYVYSLTNNNAIYKTEYFDGKYYTSFNIMEAKSRKNSITVDQAARIREVVEKCPSRWSYKSGWAFSGVKK